MPPPTEQELIDAYERMVRAKARFETQQQEAIVAHAAYDAAQTAFYTLACEFCGGVHP